MPDLNQLRDAFRARPDAGFVNLAGYDPGSTPLIDSKSQAKSELDQPLPDRLFDSHELLYAQGDRSLLLVLQGLDASGKNGTIKHTVIHMNPVAVKVASFKEPSEQERSQHFLERYRAELPEQGQLGVFNRSYYEDVIVPTVTDELDEDEVAERIDEINAFERELADAGTEIVKCMLHISYDEQRERFLRRLRRDDKRWKFSEGDVETRRHWNEFQAAYSRIIGETTPDHSPWFVIPADHKWYRNWAVAQLLVATLGSMGLDYPQPDLDIAAIEARLAPPN